MTFDDALKVGLTRAFILGIWPRSYSRLLPLKPLLAAVPPREERSGGLQDIPADKIIGTEDRSEDFSDGFFPIRRHMRQRWEKIYGLMDRGELNEPLKVLEYGGCYFVRDGHHRVSAGRALGVEFFSAEVTHLKIDVKLPPAMTLEKIPLLQAKNRFEMETGALQILGERHFRVRLPLTWDILGRNINQGHKTWFRRVFNREPSQDELVTNWNQEIYQSTLEEIRRRAVPSLFPGWDDTDIYVDIMTYWEREFPGEWFQNVFTTYLGRARKLSLRRMVLHGFHSLGRRIFQRVEEERQHFLRVSRLRIFRLEARLPRGGRRWYHFLEKQLMGPHYRYLREKLGRVPLMDELTTSWYDTLFFPALCLWEISSTDIPFSQFYPGWMLAWGKNLVKNGQLLPLDESFKAYRRGLSTRIKNRLSRIFSL